MFRGKAPDMHFIDDGFTPWAPQWFVLSPGKRLLDDDRLGNQRGIVALVERQISVRMSDGVAEHRIGPAQVAVQGLGVRVDQQLVRIEAVAGLRFIWPAHPKAVELSRSCLREEDVPHLIGTLFNSNGVRFFLLVGMIKQTQFHSRRIFRKQREIHAFAIPGRA